MNAQEIFALVKDWPYHARPPRVAYDPPTKRDNGAFLDDVGEVILDDIAELAFEASGCRWLESTTRTAWRINVPRDDRGWYIDDGMMPPSVYKWAPTRLAAISAAVMAAAKEKP